MKFTGKLLNLDGNPDVAGDCFPSDCKINIKNPVVVTHEFVLSPKTFLGFGKIKRTKKSLIYEIEINTKQLPKDFYKLLTPAVGGSIVNRNGKEIRECIIHQIGLSVAKNSDPRIKPLKRRSTRTR